MHHLFDLLIYLGNLVYLLYKNSSMKSVLKSHIIKITTLLATFLFILSACNGKLPGGDARKFPADPAKRIEQNLKEGRGFKLSDFGNAKGGVFDFASSNNLWRASLDTIDFMPLSSVNYSGGIIITDWYSEGISTNESIKVSIRFLTNEIRSDALNIKVFNRKCDNSLLNCSITETDGVLVSELKKTILKKAALYKEQDNNKKE